MNAKILPVKILMRSLLVLLLGFGVATAWSQPEPEPDAEAAAPAETTAVPAASPDKAAADPINENSPIDYQASEEISQDLSVSFPVDI